MNKEKVEKAFNTGQWIVAGIIFVIFLAALIPACIFIVYFTKDDHPEALIAIGAILGVALLAGLIIGIVKLCTFLNKRKKAVPKE